MWGQICSMDACNSHPTPVLLPDVGGDIPAAAAHSSADFGIENKLGNTKLFIPTAAKITTV